MKSMKALGITDEALVTQRPTLDQIARAIIGKTVTVKTQEAKRDGQVQMDRDGNPQVEVSWELKPPRDGAIAVTEFPPVGGGAPAMAGGSTIDPGF
jgi:hypothetical protein